MTISLRALVEPDIPFLSEVRHHPETIKFLHDQRFFSLDETLRWYHDTHPEWSIIENDGERVGYIRTSDADARNRSLKVGIDIHPQFRRRGFAKSAYQTLLERLMRTGWDRVWLEVLPTNTAAIALYEQLGFEHEGRLIGALKWGNRREDSLVMGRMLCSPTGRNAKVVVVYLGPRRAHPTNSEEGHQLLRFLVKQELTLDPGCHCDTYLVHNRDPAFAEDDSWVRRSEELLAKVDGMETPRGRLQVITRENVGISFGAYHHAFDLHRLAYDYWLFTEDDQVLVRPGCFARAIEQMEADSTVGFVAIVGVSDNAAIPIHVHGGVGISSRAVLRDVMRANPCERHPDGHLPYHWETGYNLQEFLGEIRFTNAIHALGYQLVEHAWNDICVAWGNIESRTPRMVPWTPDMAESNPLAMQTSIKGNSGLDNLTSTTISNSGQVEDLEYEGLQVDRYWTDSSLHLTSPIDLLYATRPRLGMVIGTFAAIPYVHLQLEARRRLFPHVPALLHDDCSPHTRELRDLCREYECSFESNATRFPQTLGDVSVFVGGLKWAEKLKLDILVKVSRRWIFTVDWTESLIELALESQHATFSNYTSSFGFGFRTECIGLSVSEWTRPHFFRKAAEVFEERQPIFVEAYIHQLAADLSEGMGRQARAWIAARNIPDDQRGYAHWPLMGTDRCVADPPNAFLWHDSHQPADYAALAKSWGLPYSESDFADPNQGCGFGPV